MSAQGLAGRGTAAAQFRRVIVLAVTIVVIEATSPLIRSQALEMIVGTQWLSWLSLQLTALVTQEAPEAATYTTELPRSRASRMQMTTP